MSADNPQFYSQHGEDVVLARAFSRTRGPRFFVEVGMIDGKRFSNTLALEEQGWQGVCVEAHPGYIDRVRANRPGSVVVHAAVTETHCHGLTFFADPRGDLSTLVPRDENTMCERFGKWYTGYQKVTVPGRTLDEILTEAGAPVGLEVVSIDIEGGEMAALRGLDLQRWQPRALVIEADDGRAIARLADWLEPRGYRLARVVGVNAIYTRTAADAWRVRSVRIDQQVCHTAHPVDETVGEAMIVPSDYETRGQYLRRMVMHQHVPLRRAG